VYKSRFLIAFLLANCFPARGQYLEPAFDQTPVVIPRTALPTSRLPTPEDLLAIRELHGVTIAPNGEYVAFVVGEAITETNGYRTGLFVVGTKQNDLPVELGSVGPPEWDDAGGWTNEPPQWAPDTEFITHRVKTGGVWQIWRWSRQGGMSQQLTDGHDDVESYQWIPGSTEISFTTVNRPAMSELLAASEKGILYDGTLSSWDARSLSDKYNLALDAPRQMWILDAFSGAKRPATDEERHRYGPWESDLSEKVYASPFPLQSLGHHILAPVISPDGTKVLYKLYIEGNHQTSESIALFTKRTLGGVPTQLTAGMPDLSSAWWSADGREVYYLGNEGKGVPSALKVVESDGGPSKLIYGGPDWVQNYSIDQNQRFAACTRQTDIIPPQIALLDLRTGVLRVLVEVNPEIRTLRMMRAIRINGVNRYGDRWYGHVVLPHNYQPRRRYPLVITTYRSGDNRFLKGATGDEYPIQVFAANNFVVLNFDPGSGRKWQPNAFRRALLQWESPTLSLEMAIAKLSRMGLIDRTKVAITGLSFGAELVEYVISHRNLAAAAIESGGGTRDPSFYYLAPKPWRSALETWGLRGWPEGRARMNWKAVSPMLNANRVVTPLLSNAAESEFILSLPFVVSLEALNKPVELYIYGGERHLKNQPRHRLEIYHRNLDWLNFWLRNEEDPNPAKRAQYLRWHKLKSQLKNPLRTE
jgi:dipeptidyl aminopeptidase/acylaminoacyl peptidase